MSEDSAPHGSRLGPADRDAVDAIFEGGFDPDGVAAGSPDRVRAVAGLLRLLDTDVPTGAPQARSALVDATFARALRAGDDAKAGTLAPEHESTLPTLSPTSAEAIDGLVESRWSSSHEESAPGIASVLRLLEPAEGDGRAFETGDRAALVDATLLRIQRSIDADARRFRFDAPPEIRDARRRPGLRLRELGAVAAMVLIGFAILMPAAEGMRADARRALGTERLHAAGFGFGLFGSANDDLLPAARPGSAPGRWWNVGDPDHSHSANLYVLPAGGYASLESLASPGNPFAVTRMRPGDRDWRTDDELSYSYQLFGRRVPRLSDGAPSVGVLLTDRSPVVEASKRGQPVDPNAGSANHAGLGQHVLFTDGHVAFLRSATLANGDNLWLPASLEGDETPDRLTGWEIPRGPRDAFVGP